MENLFITVMFLLVSFVHTSPSGNCSSPHSSLHCNITMLMGIGVSDCNLIRKSNTWTATFKCNSNSKLNMSTCENGPGNDPPFWNPDPKILCLADASTTQSTTATTTKTAIIQSTAAITTTTARIQSTAASAATTAKTQSTAASAATTEKIQSTTASAATTAKIQSTAASAATTEKKQSTTASTRMTTTTTTTSSQSSISTRNSAIISSHETATSERTEKTTLSTRKSPAISDNSGSVVVPVVSVFVSVVIILAAAIVFLLWRHRRMKHQKAKVDYAGTSISNRGYEDDHGLDRHISLLDMRYDDSNDSGYAEISPGKLNVEEGPDNEYQTIKDLPEDKMEGNSGYGHLKMQTTTFIDNNYSHVAVNQNGKQSSDVTYSHTGNPLNAQELKDDEETTYNHLEQNARKIQVTQQPLKNEEKEVVGDVDAEYNHAKAGHLALEPDNKGDTYSHLNNTRNSRRTQQDDLKFLTHGSKTETYRTKTGNFDSDKGDGKNTFPEYAKCAKKVNDRETPRQVGRDGYETPAGAANIYFTLEPESKLADRDVSFQVTNETFEDSVGEESPNHQYFILEKTDTNT